MLALMVLERKEEWFSKGRRVRYAIEAVAIAMEDG
jgi:hypothetical protein